MIANAGLENEQLNSMCLELSYLFDEYNCVPVASLDDYFSINPYSFKKTVF
jgi:penicillin-binding protein 2